MTDLDKKKLRASYVDGWTGAISASVASGLSPLWLLAALIGFVAEGLLVGFTGGRELFVLGRERGAKDAERTRKANAAYEEAGND